MLLVYVLLSRSRVRSERVTNARDKFVVGGGIELADEFSIGITRVKVRFNNETILRKTSTRRDEGSPAIG